MMRRSAAVSFCVTLLMTAAMPASAADLLAPPAATELLRTQEPARVPGPRNNPFDPQPHARAMGIDVWQPQGDISRPLEDPFLRLSSRRVTILFSDRILSLGETAMLLLSLLHACSMSFPSLDDISVVQPIYPALVECSGVQQARIVKPWAPGSSLEQHLRAEPPDLLINIGPASMLPDEILPLFNGALSHTMLITNLFGATQKQLSSALRYSRFQPDRPLVRDTSGIIHRLMPDAPVDIPVSQQCRHTLTALGLIQADEVQSLITPEAQDAAFANAFITGLQRSGGDTPLVVFNPLSEHNKNILTPNIWAGIIIRLVDNGYDVLMRMPQQGWFKATQEEHDLAKAIGAYIPDKIRDRVFFFTPGTLGQTIAVMAHPSIAAVVSNQTGIGHIAQMLEKPAVMLVGDSPIWVDKPSLLFKPVSATVPMDIPNTVARLVAYAL